MGSASGERSIWMAGRWMPVHSRPTRTSPNSSEAPAVRISRSAQRAKRRRPSTRAFAWPHMVVHSRVTER